MAHTGKNCLASFAQEIPFFEEEIRDGDSPPRLWFPQGADTVGRNPRATSRDDARASPPIRNTHEETGQATLILLRLLLDTLVLYIILWVALRENPPKWSRLGVVCLSMAIWKWLLYVWIGVLAIIPLLLSIGLIVRLGFSIPTRKTLYILGAFVVVRIVFGSILKMAMGVLDLFFI